MVKRWFLSYAQLMRKTYGLILSGVRSLRMKTDEAQLQFKGKTLLQYNTGKLQSLGLNEVFISGSKHGGIATNGQIWLHWQAFFRF